MQANVRYQFLHLAWKDEKFTFPSLATSDDLGTRNYTENSIQGKT